MAFIKINKQNFFHNLNQFLLKTGSKDSIAIVLKDNAYGHGLERMAKLAQEFGLTQAVVRNYNEAKIIKPYFKNILILGDQAIVDKQCSFTLNSIEDIQKAQKNSHVELKIDTGMHRNGISLHELQKALKDIQKKELHLIGIMTHNRSADELSSELFWQNKNFEIIKENIKKLKLKKIRFHSFNSASSLRLSCKRENIIRLGIGAYGYSELPNMYETLNLKPVLSLWAKKISTRKVKKGERIGYGGQFIAPKEMIISTYDLGYGDGWIRSNGLKPFVTSEKLSILGRVSMDYIILEGDKKEVCIFNNALEAGKQLETISYEMVTQLNPHLKAIII